MNEGNTWAPSETIRGQLQRGRGIGFRRALTAPGGTELVLDCVANDTRWDRQVDSRTDYLLRLVTELCIPAEAIEVDTADPELQYGLAFAVLVGMAGQGSDVAATLLHDHLARAALTDWWAVDHLWRDGGPAGRRGLRELVLARISDEDLADVLLHPGGPWRAWADDPRVAASIASRPPREPLLRPDLTPSSTDELHALGGISHSPQRREALRELSRRGDVILLDLAERPDLRNELGVMTAARAPVVGLGAVAVPRARSWLDGDDAWLRELGKEIVSTHGDHTDAEQLLTWFDSAVLDDSWCATEHLATSIARLGHQPGLPSIAYAWETTPHSYARQFYLRALIALDQPDLDGYLTEAVDDCEDAVREITRAL